MIARIRRGVMLTVLVLSGCGRQDPVMPFARSLGGPEHLLLPIPLRSYPSAVMRGTARMVLPDESFMENPAAFLAEAGEADATADELDTATGDAVEAPEPGEDAGGASGDDETPPPNAEVDSNVNGDDAEDAGTGDDTGDTDPPSAAPDGSATSNGA